MGQRGCYAGGSATFMCTQYMQTLEINDSLYMPEILQGLQGFIIVK